MPSSNGVSPTSRLSGGGVSRRHEREGGGKEIGTTDLDQI